MSLARYNCPNIELQIVIYLIKGSINFPFHRCNKLAEF